MHNLPLGYSDFKRIREEKLYYVDKTLFIKEFIDNPTLIQVLPRPRRFGKTLNLSTLYYYVAQNAPGGSEENGRLFEGLQIASAGEKYKSWQGQFPVIFLTFKDAKNLNKEECFAKIYRLIQAIYLEHSYLKESEVLQKGEKLYFEGIISLKASKTDFETSLEKLMIFLHRYHKKKVIILIDEYDAPIHGGYHEKYYKEIVSFMRNFLSGGLKDTDQYLKRAMLTGILRVAQESIFSGLNNPGVYTLLKDEYSGCFGFTEAEVVRLLKDHNLEGLYGDVKKWYNGYIFGKTTIYNPWSMIYFAADNGKEFTPYWINTSDNKLINKLLLGGGHELKQEITYLIEGQSIEKPVTENIVFPDVDKREDLLWSFLLFSGYLKQTNKRKFQNDDYYTLAIPNREVAYTYSNIIKTYFHDKVENQKLQWMLKALVTGNIDDFEELFSELVLTSLSFFDLPAKAAEKVYHAFTAGLLVWLSDDYRIKSNRESGYGRYDVMLFPHDKSKLGIVIEFKVVRKKETFETALASALEQIEKKKYEAELRADGITQVLKLAMAFQGKEVKIKEG